MAGTALHFSQLAQVAPMPYATVDGAAPPSVPSDTGSGVADEEPREKSALLLPETPQGIQRKEHRRKLACAALFFTGCGITTGAVVIMMVLMLLQATSCPRDTAVKPGGSATGLLQPSPPPLAYIPPAATWVVSINISFMAAGLNNQPPPSTSPPSPREQLVVRECKTDLAVARRVEYMQAVAGAASVPITDVTVVAVKASTAFGSEEGFRVDSRVAFTECTEPCLPVSALMDTMSDAQNRTALFAASPSLSSFKVPEVPAITCTVITPSPPPTSPRPSSQPPPQPPAPSPPPSLPAWPAQPGQLPPPIPHKPSPPRPPHPAAPPPTSPPLLPQPPPSPPQPLIPSPLQPSQPPFHPPPPSTASPPRPPPLPCTHTGTCLPPPRSPPPPSPSFPISPSLPPPSPPHSSPKLPPPPRPPLPVTAWPTTAAPTSASPTTGPPTAHPTTSSPTTTMPTASPTTATSTTPPTTASPTASPTTAPTTASPTTAPTTLSPTTAPTTASPTTAPTTLSPTTAPTTASPTASPTTWSPTTASPTTAPTTLSPTTAPTTASPTVLPSCPPTMVLVMKMNGTLLEYDSPYWIDGNLLNSAEDPNLLGNAKYAPFLTEPVSHIVVCVGSYVSPTSLATSIPHNCFCASAGAAAPYSSAQQLFSSGYIPATLPAAQQATIEDIFGITEHQGTSTSRAKYCTAQKPGFNSVTVSGDLHKARFGWFNNIPVQGCTSNDADFAIGIGLLGQGREFGQSPTGLGAGFVGWHGYTHPWPSFSEAGTTAVAAWLYVGSLA